jgi:aldehyde dehydrogenase (NAD+)
MTTTASDPVHAGALLIGGERLTVSSGGAYDHIYPATGRRSATIPMTGEAEFTNFCKSRTFVSAWDNAPRSPSDLWK